MEKAFKDMSTLVKAIAVLFVFMLLWNTFISVVSYFSNDMINYWKYQSKGAWDIIILMWLYYSHR